MKKNYLISILLVVSVFILFSCAVQQQAQVPFNPVQIETGGYTLKADNFMFVFDASSSMDEAYKGQTKFQMAKNIVSRMNMTMEGMRLTGALRTFGHSKVVSNKSTALFYGLTDYSKAGLEDALSRVTRPGGTSPLFRALNAASDDLSGLTGKTAVIVISDGKDMAATTLAAATALKGKYGSRVCIYSILAGNSSSGKTLLENIAKAGGCGFFTSADQLATGQQIADYVEAVFLGGEKDSDKDGVVDAKDKCPNTPTWVKVDASGCPLDSDRDGVADHIDRCPDTPRGVTVDRLGCPLDSDNDGVADIMDKCPGTPEEFDVDDNGCPLDSDMDGVPDDRDRCPDTQKGKTVDKNGCPPVEATKSARITESGTWVYEDIRFDTNRSDIKPGSFSILDEIVAVLKANPRMRAEIQGHTDSKGSRAYNMNLSENRARAVVAYLTEKGISSTRLSYKGYGPSRPIASNDTADGRAQNRRVELKPIQ